MANSHVDVELELGAALKNARSAAGLSQDQLGRRIGLRQTPISKFETGHQRLSFVQAVLYCRVVGLSLDELARLVPDVEGATCEKCGNNPPVGFRCLACGVRGVGK